MFMIQPVHTDILDHHGRQQVLHAHPLPYELPYTCAADIVRDQLPHDVYILDPVLSAALAPLRQWRQRIRDHAARPLDYENPVCAEDVVEVRERPDAGL